MKAPDKETIIELLEKYKTYGIVKGGELCLPKDKVLSFLDDLEKNGVGILGFDGWRYVDEHQSLIIQDPTVDVSFDKIFLSSEDYVNKSIRNARKYIQTEIPEEIDFISFTLNTPYLWKDLFPYTNNNSKH